MMPNRSDQRPSAMPAAPNPSIVSVYGSDAAARATPNSACTAGSTTTTDHMPTPPIVAIASAMARRVQDWGESTVAGDMGFGVRVARALGFARRACRARPRPRQAGQCSRCRRSPLARLATALGTLAAVVFAHGRR
jgi:hypothetical protein